MKHKFNIQEILTSIVGYRGLPFPKAFFNKVDMQTIKGTDLYKQDHLGRWYFMPVTLNYKTQEGAKQYELPHAIINVSGKKTIIETPLVGQKGSIKELISIDDYKISLAAFIQSKDKSYPTSDIETLRDIYQLNESVELVSGFTDLILERKSENDNMYNVVITSISFPALPGVEDAIAVKMEAVTDHPFELVL